MLWYCVARMSWLAVSIYLLAFYGLYVADFADPILHMVTGHTLLGEVGFLVAGMRFTIPILFSDRLPVRMSHGDRALDVCLPKPPCTPSSASS
nr:hypothetical protein GCM10017544_20970 [Microbacterium imperiale]